MLSKTEDAIEEERSPFKPRPTTSLYRWRVKIMMILEVRV